MKNLSRSLAALSLAASAFVAGCADTPDVAVPGVEGDSLLGEQASVEPTYVAGNPTCESLGLLTFEYKVDPPQSGTYDIDAYNTVTVDTDGVYFDWSSTIGIDVVLAKGGPNANMYSYSFPPDFDESFGDTGLHSPINPDNGKPYGLSHITFCYDYEVQVEKTAETSLRRTFEWGIDKVGEETELTLSPGQTYMAGYDVTVSVTGSTDSDWAVSGTITVSNPAPIAATVVSVTDLLDGQAVPVQCDVSLPTELAPGASFECSYETGLPNGDDRVNFAYAETEGLVGDGSGSAAVDFSSATVEGVGECVTVDDSLYGPLGEVCAADAPVSFSYQLAIGPFDVCGPYEVVNTASFVAPDTGVGGSDSWTVTIDVPCVGGCTLTPGYWKTHSEDGPAPYDSTWALLSDGADTPFDGSGTTYYRLLWLAPKGDPYIILAHAYIAAELNLLNGASMDPETADAYADAQALFASFELGSVPKSQKSKFIAAAQTIDDYNNGLLGPGHCSEE